MPYAPTLAPQPDMGPVPRVEFTFTTVAAGTERATVYRVTADGAQRVRGAVNVYAGGGFGGIDAEAPFGWPTGPQVAYRAEMFDAGGLSLGITDSTTTRVDFRGTVIHQPVDPSRGVVVRAAPTLAQELKRPFDGDLVKVIGRARPVYVGRGRTGLQDVDLTCFTDTPAQARLLESVFGTYGDEQLPIICFRSSLPLSLPEPFFAAVAEPTRVPFDAQQGGTTITWVMRGNEVAPPVESIAQALLTYEDLENAFAFYSQLEGAYLTYFDMETDFDLSDRPPVVVQMLEESPPGSGRYLPGNLTPVSSTAYSPDGLVPVDGSTTAFYPTFIS